MSNSPLVNYTKISPYKNSPRNHKIDKITIHHMAGNLTVETCGNVFQSSKSSANYGVGSDGSVGMYVEEKDRSWASSSPENDNRAVTIEVANSATGDNWPVSDKALEKTIELCVDICKRNGIAKLNFTGDKTGNLTMHSYFVATECPGPYLKSKFKYIADEVNRRLSGNKAEQSELVSTLYRVQVGAFSKKANAEKKMQAVKAAGFDAFLTCMDDKLWRVQIGAFSVKANADKMLQKVQAAGFSGYVTKVSGKTVTTTTPKKSVDEIALEVIRGNWGSGAERKNRLEAAGYDFETVQARVNELM